MLVHKIRVYWGFEKQWQEFGILVWKYHEGNCINIEEKINTVWYK